MTRNKDNKVIDGGEIPFDDSASPQADTLENALQSPTSSTHHPSSPTCVEPYFQKNLDLLGKYATNAFRDTYENYNNNGFINKMFHDLTTIHPSILAQTIQISILNAKACKISILELLDSEILKSSLEAIYGPEIADTGIYQAVGIDQQEQVKTEKLSPYFPELGVISQIDKRYIPPTNNPYLSLYALPVKTRPFFFEALKNAKYNNSSTEISTRFNNPLTLKEILSQAKDINQVSRVAEYLLIYNELEKQNKKI